MLYNSYIKIPRNHQIPGDLIVMYLQTTVGLEHLQDMYQHKRHNRYMHLR